MEQPNTRVLVPLLRPGSALAQSFGHSVRLACLSCASPCSVMILLPGSRRRCVGSALAAVLFPVVVTRDVVLVFAASGAIRRLPADSEHVKTVAEQTGFREYYGAVTWEQSPCLNLFLLGTPCKYE